MPLSKEEDGAHYIDLSGSASKANAAKYVFVRKDGTPSTRPDIAYHMNKMARCDVAINIVGEDHKLTFQRLKAAFQLMGIDWAPETIFYAFVNLPEGRMSSGKDASCTSRPDRRGPRPRLRGGVDASHRLSRRKNGKSRRRSGFRRCDTTSSGFRRKRRSRSAGGSTELRGNSSPSSSMPMREPAASSRRRTEAPGRSSPLIHPQEQRSFVGSRSSVGPP